MSLLESEQVPRPQESLADYVSRLRTKLGLSRQEVAQKAGIHLQSLGKIERGQTCKLNRRTLNGLAHALQTPSDYLDAAAKGKAETLGQTLRFCPHCWIPGTPLDPIWTDGRSRYCFACGARLQERCANCDEPLTSMKFRFCPYCGAPYKSIPPIQPA